jgi:hypothetical protein
MYEALLVLFHFMPKNYRGKHKFWDNFYELNEYKGFKDNVLYSKEKWRNQCHSLI